MKRGKIVVFAVAFLAIALMASILVNHPVGAAGPPSGLDVQVLNNPLTVRDAENPGRHAFQALAFCSAAPTITGCHVDFAVPANQLLVIETVSASINMPEGQSGNSNIQTHTTSLGALFHLPLQLEGNNGSGFVFYGTTQSVRLYANPGTTVTATMNRLGGSTGTAAAGASISGYLIDCGAGTGCPLP
jgi:hypothetical protein